MGNYTQSLHDKAMVLMYHKINDAQTDPWGISVSPVHFEEQVQILKNNFNITGIDELIKQLQRGQVLSNTICLTFDDGYADNYSYAKPVLEKYNCPATFFIPTAFINQKVFFWWDELEFILLHNYKLPHELSLKIEGKNYTYTLDESKLTKQQWLKHKEWKWYEKPPTKRCEIFLNIWEKLRPLSYSAIQQQITVIKNLAGIIDHVCADYLPMNEEHLLDLSKSNLFKIGLHTHTHEDLQGKEKQLQFKEILCCKETLYNKYGIESNCLAYPYGRYNDNTIAVVKELQLDACFTTDASGIDINSNITRLGRFQVCNWNASEFKEQLTAWSNH